MRNATKVLGAPMAVVLLAAAVIYQSEGTAGFRAFLNVEAAALVALGTALALCVSFPAGEIGEALAAALTRDGVSARAAEILDCAAAYAVAMGWIGTLIGVILILSSVEDVVLVPRRFALALDSLLFGLIASKLFLAPSARRLAPD